MASYFANSGRDDGQTFSGFNPAAVMDDGFDKISEAPLRNSEMAGEMAAIGAQGFQATRQNETALRLAKMQQRQRSGGGILESILPTALTIGASFIPGAGPALGAGGIVSRATKSILG